MGRNKVPVAIRTLMMIDSLEMTAEDRDLIVHQCKQCEEDQIIITHGTDTMAETAKVLAQKMDNKTIVLTGAMIPIKFGSSDGLFNLGSALAFAQALKPGVYVAMNGRCFHWDNVQKNKLTGIFEELRPR
jgi:L-asparaginase